MKLAPSLMTSLFLTATISFALPVTLILLLLGFSFLLGFVPSLLVLGNGINNAILEFLLVFGNGKPLLGMLTIGLTSTVAGILFDIFNFYRYQSLRDS
ncbi:hypothetical protein Xen7305DRAFT_00031380 [Xenococcus sp. PCC 7305]|uniref:hypothetical protein n=1 Tax=Xenococcus sp. PCC 7305 TaxID=102125 RepID=UPI0002ACB2D0|nr:hypothetical protein [Xenococcus sp. PCC 7305]ELS03414.1 hypothetical protein Xen7305DRAFT_00031380 [Xenococcus sp. PCC 7305]